MRKSFLILAVISMLIMAQAVTAAPRFQVAGCSFITAGQEKAPPIITFRVGISEKLADIGETGALYGVALGKYGESGDVSGAGVELAFFPVAPGSGLRIFLPIGTQFSRVDLGDQPITYWQAASGIGLYWDFSPKAAFWIAAKIEGSEELTTVDLASGVSIAVQ